MMFNEFASACWVIEYLQRTTYSCYIKDDQEDYCSPGLLALHATILTLSAETLS
jgi:hypothetical protein